MVRHYKDDQDGLLYDDLMGYLRGVSEMPSEEHYDLLTAWIFHTHLLDGKDVQYSPIVWFFAVPERGKSRTCKGLVYVARRGVHVESLREAYLIRMANNLNATLALDVIDLWRKAEKVGSEDILQSRFEKGVMVPRVLYPERGAYKDTVYYDIFGATVIATNEGISPILESRAIQINMPQSSRRFEDDLKPESALPLKERLVAFRARHLGRALPDILAVKNPVMKKVAEVSSI